MTVCDALGMFVGGLCALGMYSLCVAIYIRYSIWKDTRLWKKYQANIKPISLNHVGIDSVLRARYRHD